MKKATTLGWLAGLTLGAALASACASPDVNDNYFRRSDGATDTDDVDDDTDDTPPAQTTKTPVDTGGAEKAPETKPAPPPPPTTKLRCLGDNQCERAVDLGTIAGDRGSETLTAEGAASKWFVIKLAELNGSIFPAPMKLVAELKSPPGTVFDVILYLPEAADTRECIVEKTQGEGSSGTARASLSFGESGIFSNGLDETRLVTVEVRHHSGDCDENAKWSLTLTGNAQ